MYIYIHTHTYIHTYENKPTHMLSGIATAVSRLWTYASTAYWPYQSWRHISWVIMPKSATKTAAEWHVYLDGVLTLTFDGYFPVNQAMLGWLGRDAEGVSGFPYVGYFDSFMVFPIAVHGSEAMEIYQVWKYAQAAHACYYQVGWQLAHSRGDGEIVVC